MLALSGQTASEEAQVQQCSNKDTNPAAVLVGKLC